MRTPLLMFALGAFACAPPAHYDPDTGLRATGEVDRPVTDLRHGRVLMAELDDAVAAVPAQARLEGLRVLFVSPVWRTSPLAATGGQRNMAFLSAGMARLGAQVASLVPRGQTADFLAAQQIAIFSPRPEVYVERAEAFALRDRVGRFARALDRWREDVVDDGAQNEAMAAFDAATALLSPVPKSSAAQEAGRLFADGDSRHLAWQHLARAQKLKAALAAHGAQVLVADLGEDALAAVFATHAGATKVAWYVQNAGLAPDDAIIAQRASVVACSEAALEAKRTAVALARPSYVVPNGIAMRRFGIRVAQATELRQRWGLPADAFVVGQVGYVDSVKDQATTVRAFAALLQEVPNAYLVLAGGLNNRAYAEHIRALLRQTGVAQHATLLGDVDDVATVLPALDVVVSASRAEGYGLAVAEAMAARRAVVLTSIPAFVALGGDDALYFAPGDHAGLTAQLRQLLDPAVRRVRAERAQQRVHAVGADHADMLRSFASVLVQLTK